MEIIVKQGASKVDHPSRDPNYEVDRKRALRNYKKMEFESEGRRKDYERAINSNPNNVLGAPEFFPAVVIRERTTTFDIYECECVAPNQVEDNWNCHTCLKPIMTRRNVEMDKKAEENRRNTRAESCPCECASWKNTPTTMHTIVYDVAECNECHKKTVIGL